MQLIFFYNVFTEKMMFWNKQRPWCNYICLLLQRLIVRALEHTFSLNIGMKSSKSLSLNFRLISLAKGACCIPK